MKLSMSRLIRKQHKIFNSVISPITIDMMNFFLFCKIPPQVFFHYNSVCRNIIFNGIRMTNGTKENISVIVRYSWPGIIKTFLTTKSSSMVFTNKTAGIYQKTFITGWTNTRDCLTRFFSVCFTSFSDRLFRKWFANLIFRVTFFFTKFSFPFFYFKRDNIKFFSALFTNSLNHFNLQTKRLCSACLEVTVKLLTHTKRRWLAIKNPLPLSNFIITYSIKESRQLWQNSA